MNTGPDIAQTSQRLIVLKQFSRWAHVQILANDRFKCTAEI